MNDLADLDVAYLRHVGDKEARARSLIREFAPEVPFGGIVRCPMDGGFRTKAKFSVEWTGAATAGPAAGLSSPGAPAIFGKDPRRGRVPYAESAWILTEAGRTILFAVGALLAERAARAVTGFEVRVAHGGGRGHLTLAVPRDASDFDEDLADALLREVPGLAGVAVPALGIEAGESALMHVVRAAGDDAGRGAPGGAADGAAGGAPGGAAGGAAGGAPAGPRPIEADHRAFFQSNARLLPALLDAVLGDVVDRSRIVDLYCGVGLYSILAAEPSSRVLGVESNRWSLASAVRNAARHGIADARFLRRRVEDVVADHPARAPSHVFVNPSRAGCAEGVPAGVARWKPRAVTLVSCSIDSHVQDLARFRACGYRAASVRSVDMFPFTDFLENVSLLKPEAR